MKVAAPIRLVLLALVALLLSLGNVAYGQAPSALFFSEYIEGSSNNKALEIYNGTGAPVNLSGYSIKMYFNGSPTSGLTIPLTPTTPLAPGDVYVVAHGASNAAILAQADQTSSTTAAWYNGDDAVTLFNGTTLLDAIGQVGFDPGAQWGTGLTSTEENTLRRRATICQGDTNASDSFNPAVEWDGFAQDDSAGLGAHVATCGPAVTPTPTETAVGATATATATTPIATATIAGLRPRQPRLRRLP